MDPPFPSLRGLQVSGRVRRDQEDDGPQVAGHARGQAPIAPDVPRDGVQSAPLLHHQRGRDGHEALGLGAMAQLIVEGATKRVVQDLPEHEKISYSFSESKLHVGKIQWVTFGEPLRHVITLRWQVLVCRAVLSCSRSRRQTRTLSIGNGSLLCSGQQANVMGGTRNDQCQHGGVTSVYPRGFSEEVMTWWLQRPS